MSAILTREQFADLVGGPAAAIDYEHATLSIGEEFLSPEALEVLLAHREGRDHEPPPAYWTWLAEQWNTDA